MLGESFEPLGSVQSGRSVVVELGIEQNAPRRPFLCPSNRRTEQGPSDTAIPLFRIDRDALEIGGRLCNPDDGKPRDAVLFAHHDELRGRSGIPSIGQAEFADTPLCVKGAIVDAQSFEPLLGVTCVHYVIRHANVE